MAHLRILLVAAMRNEEPYLLEWLAYHRSIGFTDVVICTNHCVDGRPAGSAAVPHATAILVDWRLFGSSGHVTWQPGLVTERFTRAAAIDHGVPGCAVRWP